MSFSISYERSCPVCSNNIMDDYANGIRSGTFRCIECQEVFFICGNCSGSHCPKCNGALVDKKTSYPDNLVAAIRQNNLDEVQSLYRQNFVDFNEQLDESGINFLIVSARAQKYEICDYFINDCGASIYLTDKHGRTALMDMIICRGATPSKKLTALFGGSVNAQDNDGNTALMFAAEGAGLFGSRKGNVKLIQQLIEIGADSTIENKLGYTALGLAEKSNNQSAVWANQAVVEYLEQELLKSTAMNEFKNNYDYSLSEKGVLLLQKKP